MADLALIYLPARRCFSRWARLLSHFTYAAMMRRVGIDRRWFGFGERLIIALAVSVLIIAVLYRVALPIWTALPR